MSKVTIDTTEVDRIMQRLGMNTAQVINRIAFEIESQAKQNAPVDTGALKNSINTSAASSLHPTATVSDGVEYGIYQEYGTSRMAAQPFLTPAVESVAQKYNSGAAWEEIIK
jgi:HK97 gp10 family phage protein